MKLRTYGLFFKALFMGLLFIGLLGLPSCGGEGLDSDALYILSEVNKGDDSYIPPSDVTSATFVATSMDILSNSVTDATVTVKNANAPYFMIGYITQGTPAISEGEDVDITVVRGENTVTATLPMPEKPVITSPADDSWHDANSQINVQWTLSTTPDLIFFEIEKSYTVSGEDYTAQLAGTATSHSIPAGTLRASINGIEINVYSVNMTSDFTGTIITGSIYATSHVTQIEIHTN